MKGSIFMKYPEFKQWNTEDLFNEALRLVKENGYYPDESDLPLESCHAYAEYEQMIFGDCWKPAVAVSYGGSEGIYIDVYIAGPGWTAANQCEYKRMQIGIAKTLNADIGSFVKMSTLAGAIKAYLTEIWMNDDIYSYHFVTPEGAKKMYEEEYVSITDDRIGRAQTSDDVERCRQYIKYKKVLTDTDRAELLSACDEKEKQI